MSHFFHRTEARTSILSPSRAGSLPEAWENGRRDPWIPVHTAVPLSCHPGSLIKPTPKTALENGDSIYLLK